MQEKYLELYKKHKPKSWGDIIGQRKIVNSLRSAVRANKVPVAYLFSGPRGTGKTSAAKVLAAAINCLDETSRKLGDACGVCDSCVNIYADSQLGVNYTSMANKGGVDEVRRIVEQARMSQPVNKTVWILDEVHNLSSAAWDSLLIPLESPSMPSLFILCSTEAHKIPEPILSRVQSRKFNLVKKQEIQDYLRKICEADGIDVTEDEIISAAQTGRGSVRDSLTALDAILSTGELTEDYSKELLNAVFKKSIIKTLTVIKEYVETGEKVRYLAEDLYSDLRDLLILRARNGGELVDNCPVDDIDEFKSSFTLGQHTLLLESVGKAVTDMSIGSAEHRIIFETALIYVLQKIKRTGKAS